MLKITLSILAWLTATATAGTSLQGSPNASAMLFFPPGASSCGEFLGLEPMQKYDTEGTPLGEGDAENYFAYRSIEEWVRGFFTAANMFHVENGSGNITNGVDLHKLMPQLFDYCRLHPDEVFSNAALHLLTSLNRTAPHQ